MSKKKTAQQQTKLNNIYTCWKTVNGKRYQLKVIEQNGRVEKLYKLQISTNKIERFTEEDQKVFSGMEQYKYTDDFDFEALESELNSIDFPAIR